MIYFLLVLAFFLGWWCREILILLKSLPKKINVEPEKPKKESKTSFAEPIDPLQFAAMEDAERIKKLNE